MLKLHKQQLFNAIIEVDLLQTISTLFSEFPWNNFL